MNSWPINLLDGSEMPKPEGHPSPAPGTPIPVVRTGKNGETTGYLVYCPGCGEYGAVNLGEGGWEADEGAPGLTLHPSVLCNCGGHYWAHNGVLTGV